MLYVIANVVYTLSIHQQPPLLFHTTPNNILNIICHIIHKHNGEEITEMLMSYLLLIALMFGI